MEPLKSNSGNPFNEPHLTYPYKVQRIFNIKNYDKGAVHHQVADDDSVRKDDLESIEYQKHILKEKNEVWGLNMGIDRLFVYAVGQVQANVVFLYKYKN